ELAHGGRDRTAVDELGGGDGLAVHHRHAVLHDALCADKTDAVLVLDELTDAADAAVGEVVDIIGHALAGVEADEFAEDLDEVRDLEHAVLLVARDLHVEAAVQLVAGDGAHVVLLEIEEETVDQL